MTVTDGYPLKWPNGFKRTPAIARRDGNIADRMSPGRILDLLEAEVHRLGGRDLIVSCNLRMRPDGVPYARQNAVEDPGIAVYFHYQGQQHAMACDVHVTPWKNIRAITLCIQALRSLERHGGGHILARAFDGFKALPAAIIPHVPWWEVLEIESGASEQEIREAHRKLIRAAHVDAGGDHDRAADINRARDEGLQAIGSN